MTTPRAPLYDRVTLYDAAGKVISLVNALPVQGAVGLRHSNGNVIDLDVDAAGRLKIRSGGLQPPVSVTKALASAVDYVADDVMSESASAGTVWTFSGVLPSNGDRGYIVKVQAIWETIGLTPSLTVHWFTATPTSELNDGLPNTALLHADLANYVGPTDLPAMSGNGGDSVALAVPSTSGNLPMAFQCALEANDLIGIVVTNDAVTGEVDTDDLTIIVTCELG